ncbi:peptidyl-glycine alpha-amidating monooxygenase B isoform X3 [Engraulis encrasicolus]|uniref:peptidyl-glycine alpha-amidating monooxygenase B isoform X3 n=1 Tax=Engraulis encrasicolus TaxID=184585 RepID=UPI002FCF30DA
MMGFVWVCGTLLVALVCQSHSYSVREPLGRFKRYQEASWSDPNDCSRLRQPVIQSNPHNVTLDIRMPGVIPAASDTYLCMAVPVPTQREAYIVDFVPHATMDTAHHMLLYGCKTPVSTKGYWDCGTEMGTCEDEAKIMYAWARNAPPTKLPRDVGFKVGGDTHITHFVLQLHYGDISAFKDHHRDCSGLTLTMTSKPQPFIAGIYLMMSVDSVILPGKRVTNADIACSYDSFAMHPFAFRTHTHHLGQVVSGYRIRDGKWTLIGRQSPQLPQAFYPVANSVSVEYGDTLAARCVFTGEGRTTKTRIGGTSDDEMCNFYIMYYMESKHAEPYMDCMEHGPTELFRNIPAEANVPIPVSPDHMMMSMTHGGHSTDHQDDTGLLEPKRSEADDAQGAHLEEVLGWPEEPLPLGQVSGLALDSDENLVIFHRGDHTWDYDTFDRQERYMERSLGPIRQPTILVVDPAKGKVLRRSGRDMFHMPHGITMDKDNNYWVTDVALHQVMKLSGDGKDTRLVVLGQAFVPGSDVEHFCKPTDVAVDPLTGSVFVSDGYCNRRIMKFSPQGTFLKQWGAGPTGRKKPVPFLIPHSLTFLPDRRQVCVADRENARIQCFLAETGEYITEIKNEAFGKAIFALTYLPEPLGGLFYVINGESAPLKGFIVDYSTHAILDTFSPDTQKFLMPHDLVVNRNGTVFVGDVDTQSVTKFAPGGKAEHRSVKKGGLVQEIQQIEETETIVEARLKPIPPREPVPSIPKIAAPPPSPPKQETQKQKPVVQEVQKEKEKEKEKEEKSAAAQGSQGVSPGLITTLLLIPLAVLVVGGFVCWKRGRNYGDDYEVKLDPNSSTGILGKLRGKAAGTLNLGNFFASRQGYTRQGFDPISNEDSDQEKDDEDATDSENEEYAAPPLPPISSS